MQKSSARPVPPHRAGTRLQAQLPPQVGRPAAPGDEQAVSLVKGAGAQDPIDYLPNLHHANQDIYDHCVPEDLFQSAIVMAAFVYHTAMRDQMLPRKPPRIPVEVKESPVR